ncbi:hypothetical protein [Wufeng Rattus nitidus jeilongvirus 1]|uniref:Uncharacterized protein n=1 Tax=Wufeng Rattus nitidus jeilongvirus 1 TaxID=2877503 RepID=A0AAE8XRW5_9MONO|nr:hypothetical protein [Wufeng Rattus nitidus jeilongvirus 1]
MSVLTPGTEALLSYTHRPGINALVVSGDLTANLPQYVTIATHKQPAAQDSEPRLIRLITQDYDSHRSIDQLGNIPLSTKQPSDLSSFKFSQLNVDGCSGYVSENSYQRLTRRPTDWPGTDPSTYSVTLSEAYVCTNTSDTYLVPFSPTQLNQGPVARSARLEKFGPSHGELGVVGSYVADFKLPVSKIELMLAVRDIRQQGYTYACMAVDVCGFPLFVVQNDDATVYYYPEQNLTIQASGVSVHLESICEILLSSVDDHDLWMYEIRDAIRIDTHSNLVLLHLTDFHYQMAYGSSGYCKSRIMKSFWGYFGTKELINLVRNKIKPIV